MARPYRREKIASSVRNLLSEAIAQELHDPRVTPLSTTITRVEVTPDLQLAKVYISVLGGDAAERRTIAALSSACGWMRRYVAAALPMRRTPELRFLLDEGARIARQTMELLAAEQARYGSLSDDDDDDDGDGDGALEDAEVPDDPEEEAADPDPD
jgi:ribosome-binding factor A